MIISVQQKTYIAIKIMMQLCISMKMFLWHIFKKEHITELYVRVAKKSFIHTYVQCQYIGVYICVQLESYKTKRQLQSTLDFDVYVHSNSLMCFPNFLPWKHIIANPIKKISIYLKKSLQLCGVIHHPLLYIRALQLGARK